MSKQKGDEMPSSSVFLILFFEIFHSHSTHVRAAAAAILLIVDTYATRSQDEESQKIWANQREQLRTSKVGDMSIHFKLKLHLSLCHLPNSLSRAHCREGWQKFSIRQARVRENFPISETKEERKCGGKRKVPKVRSSSEMRWKISRILDWLTLWARKWKMLKSFNVQPHILIMLRVNGVEYVNEIVCDLIGENDFIQFKWKKVFHREWREQGMCFQFQSTFSSFPRFFNYTYIFQTHWWMVIF